MTLLVKLNFTTCFFSCDKTAMGKCVLQPQQKPWLWTEKTEGTSSAIFGAEIAAKCCKLKRCAERVRRRTDNKDEVLEGKFRNLNFKPFIKKTTEYSFELFLSIYRY